MEELDLKELFEIFWQKKVYVALIVAIFFVIGVTYTFAFVEPKYSASTTLALAQSSTSSATENAITTTDITINSKLVSTYSELVKSKMVLRQVKTNLNMDIDEEVIKNNIKVSSVKDTELIEITVTTENAKKSAKVANEVAKVFTEKIKEIYNIDNVQVIDEAEIDEIPSNINHKKDIIVFIFIGLVVAVVYVLLANMLDTTVKTAEEVEKEFKLPVLASIPLYDADQPSSKGRGGRR